MKRDLLLRIIYFFLFAFCIWLALATRHDHEWFAPIVVKYGGDTIWAGAFLFLLRAIFIHYKLRKLAITCYVLGVLDELSQLIQAPWAKAIRSTTLGRLMFGVGFVWTDLVCYAVGTISAYIIICLIEMGLKKSYP